jgi:hypothetical protein
LDELLLEFARNSLGWEETAVAEIDPSGECARKAGKEQEVKVPHGEGLANHPDPE